MSSRKNRRAGRPIPTYVVDWDLVPAKVSVSFNGKVVAESDQVRVMYELGHAPIYYFPKVGAEPAVLREGGRTITPSALTRVSPAT